MGESERSQQAKDIQGKINNLNSMIEQQDFTVENRFDNYKNPFDYSKKKNALDALTSTQSANISQRAATDIADNKQDVTARLASQGVTGGSILNDQINQVENRGTHEKFNALKEIGIARLGQETGIMEQENDNQFRTTSAGQNTAFQNVMNVMKKYGLMQGGVGMNIQNLQNMDDSSWSDVMGMLLGAGAKVGAAAFPH